MQLRAYVRAYMRLSVVCMEKYTTESLREAYAWEWN